MTPSDIDRIFHEEQAKHERSEDMRIALIVGLAIWAASLALAWWLKV